MDRIELSLLPLFANFTDQQLDELLEAAEELHFEVGDVLFTEATPAELWWVLLEGRADLLRHVGREDVVVAKFETPGQWSGGFRAWDPAGVYMASAHATSPIRILRMPADRLRALADRWTPFGVHLIRGLMQTVRAVESTVRQRESLVALGRISAGLAHEINNPASAAVRAVDVLESSCTDLTTALRELAARSITAEQFVALDELRQQIAVPAGPVGARELSGREDDLYDWLGEHRVDRDWVIAPALASAGLDPAWCERVVGVTSESALGPALEWIAASLSIDSVLAELKDATGRISGLVSAVRSYSQMDRASTQEIDVTEGIDSTLVMLGGRLRPGIEIVRRYATDLPRIEAVPGELNQVWTNLIDNAIDAMGGKGALTIRTAPCEDGVEVEIEDNGPGIPDEVKSRIFEPFFTTKEVGKGTGLGLDISYRIVTFRHGGRIQVHSKPGKTVFSVYLPANPPKESDPVAAAESQTVAQ
jgi:signal transduction histidine kinase